MPCAARIRAPAAAWLRHRVKRSEEC